jgi:hypothetical protein
MLGLVKRELWWFAIGFGIPFGILVVVELWTASSKLSIWERISRLEDVCAYGVCLVLPTTAYFVVLWVRFIASVR